jgi:transposase InsO family protein
MRNNNGGELCEKEFDQFCKKCGIEHQNTMPYTPHQNGISERMNKTLMNKERIMLSGVGLAQEFWVEAVDTTKYILNMSPSSTLIDNTPHEVWLGKKPSVSHLKVFCCDVFVNVPKEKWRTLGKKEIKCVFIGYNEGMKGYKLWDIASSKTMYSRYLAFREVRSNSEPKEIVHTKNNLETMWLELRNEEYDSNELTELEEEVEQPTLVVRRSERVRKLVERYSLLDFCSTFMLTAIDDEPKSVGEVVDSGEEKL